MSLWKGFVLFCLLLFWVTVSLFVGVLHSFLVYHVFIVDLWTYLKSYHVFHEHFGYNFSFVFLTFFLRPQVVGSLFSWSVFQQWYLNLIKMMQCFTFSLHVSKVWVPYSLSSSSKFFFFFFLLSHWIQLVLLQLCRLVDRFFFTGNVFNQSLTGNFVPEKKRKKEKIFLSMAILLWVPEICCDLLFYWCNVCFCLLIWLCYYSKTLVHCAMSAGW